MKRFAIKFVQQASILLTGIIIAFVHAISICLSQWAKNTSGLTEYAGLIFIDPILPDNKTLV